MPLEATKSKLQKITDTLYKDTIIPAKEEAEKILSEAEKEASKIIHNANQESQKIISKAKNKNTDERKVHETSIDIAVKQSLERLRSDVMNIFNNEIISHLKETLNIEKNCHEILHTLILAMQKEGIYSDLRLSVSEGVNFDSLANSVMGSIKGKLEKGDLNISSGVCLLIEDQKLALKITEETLNGLLAQHLPATLRAKVFS